MKCRLNETSELIPLIPGNFGDHECDAHDDKRRNGHGSDGQAPRALQAALYDPDENEKRQGELKDKTVRLGYESLGKHAFVCQEKAECDNDKYGCDGRQNAHKTPCVRNVGPAPPAILFIMQNMRLHTIFSRPPQAGDWGEILDIRGFWASYFY